MICVVIKGPTCEKARQQILKAMPYADLVELRLDYFHALNLAALQELRSDFSIPMIFTLRSKPQGGNYLQSEEQRLADILELAGLQPDYLDIENHVPSNFIEKISLQWPKIKIILSYHNFTDTPEDLEGIYQTIRKTTAYFYKIAVTARNCLDALRLICWARAADDQLIAISMGPHGQMSRILAPIMGCPITYAALEENQESAPGQLSAKILIERYHHRTLNKTTTIYGLIGDPVDQSISDVTHNSLIAATKQNAVYIKIQVNPLELSEFLQFAKRLPFHGLSVTMPLKEHILPLLDKVDSQAQNIGAVNTLLFKNGHILGFNTDGIGALNAIEKDFKVKNKRMIIIGAGGAAKAIAYEALRRGALVTILNRDPYRAREIAEFFQCTGNGLDSMLLCAQTGYDILINSTPVPQPIDPKYILPQAIVMDIKTKPKETTFLKLANEKSCPIIYGYQMFLEQAIGQFNLWFNKPFGINETLEKIITAYMNQLEAGTDLTLAKN